MAKKKASTMTKRPPRPARARPKAATSDLLSAPKPSVRIDSKWREHYKRLKELRNFFDRQKSVLARDANDEAPAFSEHMADAGTDSYDRDFALSMLSSDQNALYEIDAAIRRIEEGVYGICELTGKPIAAKRLEAIPWARFSLEAERQLEQRGAVNRAHLGNLGSFSEAGGEGEELEEREREREHERGRRTTDEEST